MLDIIRLAKSFGQVVALDDVSFRVAPGEIVGLIGPNGAGRSTLLRIIAGSVAPTSGTATIGGHDIRRRPLAAKQLSGYLPHNAPAYPDMTAAGFLDFVSRIRGGSGAAIRRRIGNVAGQLGLGEILRRPIAALAAHERRRLGVAQALLHDPPLLLLDEPTDGIDPIQRRAVRDAIRTAAPGKAIVMASNLLDDVEALCNRIIVIVHGQIRVDATPIELIKRSRYHNAVRLVPAGRNEAILAEELRRVPAIRSIEPASDAEGEGWWLFPWRGRPIAAELAELARQRGWPVAVLRGERGRLDDVFPLVTTGDIDAAAEARDAA